MELTDRVSGWCNQRGHSKAEVAELLGITPNTMTSRLAGETGWSWIEACKLADMMGVPLDELADKERR